jgi:hypothetical protein
MKMKLKEFPPQHVPMCGRRVRLYYKEIAKKCGKCLGDNRPADCKNDQIPWINYVRDFQLDHPEVKPELYGRWARILEEEEAAGKLAKTERVWTRRSLDGEEIRTETVTESEEENRESAIQEEIGVHGTSGSESDESEQEVEENPRENEQTRAEIELHKRECKIAGLDANPILEKFEKSLLSSGREQRSKTPKSTGQADEEECIKRTDKTKKITVTRPEIKKRSDEEFSKVQKKTSTTRGRGKTDSQ